MPPIGQALLSLTTCHRLKRDCREVCSHAGSSKFENVRRQGLTNPQCYRLSMPK